MRVFPRFVSGIIGWFVFAFLCSAVVYLMDAAQVNAAPTSGRGWLPACVKILTNSARPFSESNYRRLIEDLQNSPEDAVRRGFGLYMEKPQDFPEIALAVIDSILVGRVDDPNFDGTKRWASDLLRPNLKFRFGRLNLWSFSFSGSTINMPWYSAPGSENEFRLHLWRFALVLHYMTIDEAGLWSLIRGRMMGRLSTLPRFPKSIGDLNLEDMGASDQILVDLLAEVPVEYALDSIRVLAQNEERLYRLRRHLGALDPSLEPLPETDRRSWLGFLGVRSPSEFHRLNLEDSQASLSGRDLGEILTRRLGNRFRAYWYASNLRRSLITLIIFYSAQGLTQINHEDVMRQGSRVFQLAFSEAYRQGIETRMQASIVTSTKKVFQDEILLVEREIADLRLKLEAAELESGKRSDLENQIKNKSDYLALLRATLMDSDPNPSETANSLLHVGRPQVEEFE